MGGYLIQVIAAGILCCIVRQLLGNKGAVANAVKLLSGVFMALVIVAPILNIRIDAVLDDLDQFKTDGLCAATDGENSSKDAMAKIIIDKTQAYILDKANSLGAEVTVEIELTDERIPCAVTVTGKISPYDKQALSKYMESELGIRKEAQRWIG